MKWSLCMIVKRSLLGIKVIKFMISYLHRYACFLFHLIFLGRIYVVVYTKIVHLVCLWNDPFSIFPLLYMWFFTYFDLSGDFFYLIYCSVFFVAVLQEVTYLYVCKLIRIFYLVDWLIDSWLILIFLSLSLSCNTSGGD